MVGQKNGSQHSDVGTRIVGGEQTTIERFPWIVSLQRNGVHFCGGSIISATRILSAAHCTPNPNGIFARAGSTNNLSGGQLIAVSQVHNHPQYNDRPFNNDICVLVLSSALNLAPAGVAIIPMPAQNAGVATGGELKPR